MTNAREYESCILKLYVPDRFQLFNGTKVSAACMEQFEKDLSGHKVGGLNKGRQLLKLMDLNSQKLTSSHATLMLKS